jgi:hypothetical protein
MKKLALLAIGAIVLMTSCKKDEASTTCTLSSTSIQGTYKATAGTYQADAQSPVEDEFSTLEPCEKDDLLVIGNGTFSTNEGATSCTPPTDSESGTWSLSGNQLSVTNFGVTLQGTVESFSCNSMVLKVVYPDNSITRTTYSRQ